MRLADTLLSSAYPAVAIQRWTSSNGWDKCYRVVIFATQATCFVIDAEHDTFAQAHAAASDYAAGLLPAIAPILDMTERDS